MLLPPLPAAAESQVQTGAGRRLTASAHVNFKIVIPNTLSMDVPSGVHAQTVAIGSNGRTVVLAATVPGSELPRHDLILGAAARKSIAQDAACALGAHNAVICTASMP
jgi:hypothetical protein